MELVVSVDTSSKFTLNRIVATIRPTKDPYSMQFSCKQKLLLYCLNYFGFSSTYGIMLPLMESIFLSRLPASCRCQPFLRNIWLNGRVCLTTSSSNKVTSEDLFSGGWISGSLRYLAKCGYSDKNLDFCMSDYEESGYIYSFAWMFA